ncbi:AAA family ATPase [Botryobacter ruber]|uniref:AAA family ATPase n=1 Tax=Botryobacter ruber TaxID=2171629 RepID=UPI000E0B8F9C|nr:AAA family ATPase [Botryobacter ruber]
MQAIIFCGIQGSGKSTYYQEHFFHTHVRISLDLLRTRNRERHFLQCCFRTQQRFVVDNTNPTIVERQRYILLAREARYEVTGYFFETGVKDALARNSHRTGKLFVPEKGIYGTWHKLQVPTLAEGFDQLFRVRILPDGSYHVYPDVPDSQL